MGPTKLLQTVQACSFPVTATVVDSLASPTRALRLGLGFCSAKSCSNCLPGVPRHRAVCYTADFQPDIGPCRPSRRCHRCALYTWQNHTNLTAAQSRDSLGRDRPLQARFRACRADAVCHKAVKLGLAGLPLRKGHLKGLKGPPLPLRL